LLSDEATVDTKPQLEIYADDVKCTPWRYHRPAQRGIDFFYLRARGIGAERARRMLIHAFAGEIIERIRYAPGSRGIGSRRFGIGWKPIRRSPERIEPTQ